MKREEGYYWVVFGGIWEIMRWVDNGHTLPYWFQSGFGYAYVDNDMDQINETRLLPPNEPQAD